MNKTLINLFAVLGVIGAILGLIFSFLPLYELAIFPASIGLILGLIAFYFAKKQQIKVAFSKVVVIVSLIAIVVSFSKQLFLENEIENDQEFVEKEKLSEEDAKKDLEELDELEDLE